MPTDEWNELVPPANRLPTTNKNERPAGVKPTHIVIHITGTEGLAGVKSHFTKLKSVSAHYLIGKKGELFQFVPDAARAFHAGIESVVRRLYGQGPQVWRRHLKYYKWYTGYGKGAIFVDGDLQPVWDKTEAVFVTRADGQPWPQYKYVDTRWPNDEAPINFAVHQDPNDYSIGIETLGFGATKPSKTAYTPEMYATLQRLVTDLTQRHDIPMKKGRVVGHEDVNPIGRFGWDPGQGFDWSVVNT